MPTVMPRMAAVPWTCVRDLRASSDSALPAGGLVVLCNGDGAIQRWLQDDLGINRFAAERVNFLRLLHDSNQLKGLSLLARLRSEACQVNWELCFEVADTPTVLQVAAAPDAAGTVIAAARSAESLKLLCRQVGTIYPELSTSCLKLLSALDPEGSSPGDARVQDDFMRMYNDFARLQREYAGQKAQLSRIGAEKDRLMNMAVHDLRSPLSVIALLAGSLSHQAGDRLTTDERSVLTKIVETAKDMGRSLGDMLDSAKYAPTAPKLSLQSGDLKDVVESRLDLLVPLAKRKGIKLTMRCEANLPSIRLDSRRIQHVIDNLLGNALKFSPADAVVEVRLLPVDRGVLMEVRDQGPGIPEEELDSIFDAFVQGTAAPTAGEASNGLGLAICRSVVIAHGGKIWAENLPDGGAVLRVFLEAC